MDDDVMVRVAGAVDTDSLAGLRQAWTEELLGRAATDPEFGERFADWHAVESGRRRGGSVAADERAVARGESLERPELIVRPEKRPSGAR